MTTPEEQASSVELLWGERARPERKPRVALSLTGIVDAAIEIADTDGIEAVSMQRVAGDLGFTKMSLYRHVASKAELFAVMIDKAVGEPPDLSAVPGGWRPRLEEFTRQLIEIWAKHPWLPTVTVGSRAMGPREVGWTESAVGAFTGTGLRGDERLAAVFMLFGHIRTTHSMATAGTQPWTADEALAELIQRRGAAFPELAAAFATSTPALSDNGRRFGLDRIFDGLATLIEQRS